ncbi:astacin-like metalloendopeptidase isoform 2-T2 [Liasis olivaceus]
MLSVRRRKLFNTLGKNILMARAQPVQGRGDTFQVAPTPGQELEEQENPRDDILDINQGLIPPEAPENSFLLKGDIIKVSPFRSFFSARPRWPKKKGIVQIPYIISYKYDNLSVKIIKEAFEDFAKFTCIKFVPYSYQRDFISIVPLSGNASGPTATSKQQAKIAYSVPAWPENMKPSYFSSAGRIGGMQVVSLAPGCLKRGKGVALHQLMHVLGFWHEHSRADRDKYISIFWNEILSGFEINFIKSWNTNMLKDYDCSSIMHYGRNAFSMTGLPTITPLSSPPASLGQRWNLSILDIARVNKLYKCSQVAAQPVVTKEAIKEKVMDFVPVQPEPCSAENNLDRSPSSTAFVRETTETILSPQGTVGEGLSIVADQTRRTEVLEQSVVVSAETSRTSEAIRELQMTSKSVLDTTKTRQMETNATGSVVENASSPWTSQNQYSKAYIPVGQSRTETRTRLAPEMEQTSSSQTKGPVLSPVEIIHGATVTLGQKEAGVEVFGAKATVLEPTVELSTAVELASSLVMESSETEDGIGSPRAAEGYHVSVVEKQPKEQLKEAFHQAVTVSINETNSPAYIHPVEDVLTNTTSSLYISSTLGNPTTISSPVELEKEPQGAKVEGLANIATIPGSSGREEEAESSYYEKATVLTYTRSPSSKKIYTAHEHGEALLPRRETPVPETPEAQTDYLDWFTTGAPSSLQGVVTSHPAASKLKELGSLHRIPPTRYSMIAEPFSLLPPHLARHGYEWATSITHKPPRSVSLHATEQPVEAEKHTLDRGELPSQIPTWGEVASLAIKTNMAVQEQRSETAGPGDNGSWSQTSSDRHHLPRIITLGWSPPADVERQTFEKTIETASMTTIERLPMTQKIDVSCRERHGGATLTRQFPIEPSGSQVSTQLEQGSEETQSQHSSTFSIIAGVGNHEIQAINSNGLRTVVSPKQCGEKLAASASETLTSHMEHATEKLSSLDRQLKLGITGKRSPRPEIQEYGPTSGRIFLLGRERNTSPRSLNGSLKPGGGNGTSNFKEHLKEETLPVQTNAFMQTTPKKRAPEITMVSGTRAAESLTVGSSNLFTTLAHSKPTLKRLQSHFSLGGTDSVTHSESLSAGSLKLSSQLKERVPSAEGRSIQPADSTEGLTVGGMNWVTDQVQEGTAGRHSTGAVSLELQPTSLEGTGPLLIIGSLQSPKLVNRTEGSLGSHLRMDTSPLPRKELDTTVALSIYLSSAIILGSRENRTIIRTDSKQATGTPSKASGEMQMEANGGTLASTEIHGTPHAGVSTLGSHEEHTKRLPFQSELQTRIKLLEGITGPASDAEASTLFLEEKWKSLPKENDTYRSEEPAAAKPTETGSKGSEQNSIGITGATSLSVESSSQLISTNSTEKTEESTIFSERKWNAHSSAGPSSQQYSVAFMPPRSGTATPEVVPSVPDVYNSHDTEKMETAGMYQAVTELPKGASVPARISLPHLQTLGSAEMKRRPSMTYGAKGLEETTKIPTRVRNGELSPLAIESSRQVSETQIAMKLEEVTRSRKKERKLEENKAFLASNPIYLHHINKRSLPGIMATLPFFILSSPAPICKLLQSNIGQVNSRKLSILKLFPKKHMHKTIMASSGGTAQQLLPSGCLQGYLSPPAIAQNVALSTESMTRAREPEKLILRSTSKSKSLALFQKLSPSVKKAGNNQGPNQRTADHTSISCSFKENLCGWKQSKNDSLDWMLDKEDQQSTESMEDRSLDGYISLKPSSHLPKQKAVLISPVVYGIRCLKFWYRPTDCATGKIHFYIKLLNSTEWQKVWSMKGKQDIGWHQVTINISRTWALQVALEGIVGNEVRCKARIDDLVLCRKPCGQCFQ